MKVFAIVGMGLCGNAIFCRLIDELQKIASHENEIHILIFEQNPQYFATGSAYAIDSPACWTLNNPADGFRFVSTTESLTQWLSDNQDLLKNNFDKQYIPRALVGHYLRAQYSKHKAIAKSMGIKVHEIVREISDIHALQEGNYQISYADQKIIADVLFLTTGHLKNHFFHAVESKSGFLRLETGKESLECELPNELYIIGGQAAFVDAALWLTMEKQYSGKIHSITRSPAILTTKGNPDDCDTKAQQELSSHLQKQDPGSLSFSEAKQLFWNAYEKDAQAPVDTKHLPGARETLAYQMNKYDHLPENKPIPGNVDELRAFIKAFYFNGCYAAMWQSLNEVGKEQFLNHFYSLLMAYLTGITPSNARIMLHLYEANRIVEHQGLVSVTYDEENSKFELIFTSKEVLYASTIIDASGYRYKPKINSTNPMLLDKLADKGLISVRNCGGMALTDHFQVIDTHDKVHENLFCIGPVANYNHPVPTPHSSFMVYRDVELVIGQLALIKMTEFQL